MTGNHNPLPDITRPDAGSILVGEWALGTPQRQRAAANAIEAAWKRKPRPQGLLSYTVFAGTDGNGLLHYAQWTSDEALREFVRTQRQTRIDEIDAAVPGIERLGAFTYRLYRSTAADAAQRVPGCIVVVSVEFDGPDAERQRLWVDAVFDALEAEPELPRGGISGHFHVSTDRARVLNYAEWTDEQAHREAMERSGQGSVGSGPKWRHVQNFPGLKSSKVKRYSVSRSIA